MSLPSRLQHRDKSVLLKFHKFNSGRGEFAPNSLGALEEALEAGAEVIEFDVSMLGDGSYALLHDARLERETDGRGPLGKIGRRELKALTLRDSVESPALLDEVVERLGRHDRTVKVQVDLKEVRPLEASKARILLDALQKLRENPSLRLVVGCMADWNLRLLRREDSELAVGNDPVFYLHSPSGNLQVPFPTRVNAYGYIDDHPLGYRRNLPVATYLRDRLESIVAQIPGTSEFYLHRAFVAQALGDGFDPIAFLREETGVLVDVWTFNAGDDDLERELRLALEAGCDQITTDTALDLAGLTAAWSS